MGSVEDPRGRDAMLRRVRALKTSVALGAAVGTAALSVTAAHAFKGHDGRKVRHAARVVPPRSLATPSVSVPGPDRVPSIAGSPPPPQPLTPPAQAPTSVPVPAATPETSGGS